MTHMSRPSLMICGRVINAYRMLPMGLVWIITVLALFQLSTHASEQFSYYANSDEWGGLCADGTIQSPIDIRADNSTRPPKVPAIVAYSNATDLHTQHTEHGYFQVIVPAGSSIDVNGTQYALKSIHWHAPSEHALNGTHALAEMHIVHSNEAGDSAVVAVLYEHGEEGDDLLQLLLDNLPPSTAQKSSAKTASIGSVDLSALLESTVPEGYDSTEGHFWSYTGSLTTPPCTQGVTWLVSTRLAQITDTQLVALEKSVGEVGEISTNSRPLQAASPAEQIDRL